MKKLLGKFREPAVAAEEEGLKQEAEAELAEAQEEVQGQAGGQPEPEGREQE